MTAVDIFVLLLVGMLSVRGFSAGFVTETLSLIAWIAAIVAVNMFHAPVTERLAGAVGTTSGASVLAFAVIFGITFLLGKLVARRIGGASKRSVVGGFDRILGFGFGALKGLIGASLIFLVTMMLHDVVYGGQAARPDWIAGSKSYPLLTATSRALVDFIEIRRRPNAETETIR